MCIFGLVYIVIRSGLSGLHRDKLNRDGLRLPRFDGQGRWLDQATFASASVPVAASNSLGVR
jgi:hypothetical protein